VASTKILNNGIDCNNYRNKTQYSKTYHTTADTPRGKTYLRRPLTSWQKTVEGHLAFDDDDDDDDENKFTSACSNKAYIYAYFQ
jgi:hypothetical protein